MSFFNDASRNLKTAEPVRTGIHRRCRRNSRGQAATEYMLIVAVVVLGLVSAASAFIPTFKQAVTSLSQNVAGWLTTNQEMANPK